jgi:phospholipid transport system transporter-binding protein
VSRTPALELTVHTDDHGRYILEGELDKASVPWLLQQPRPAAPDGVRVDLAGIRRVDSAGLAGLLDWLRTTREGGVDLTFENVPDQLIAIAEVSGVRDILAL